MKPEHKRQLQAEIVWAATRTGAFQRSRIYANADDGQKEQFRNAVKEFLFTRVYLKYQGKQVTEKELMAIIDRLVSKQKGNEALAGKALKFGNAQKFVNLYLKCMWLCGFCKAPPHFPVDRIILNKLKIKGNWTDMRRDEYKAAIKRANEQLADSGYKSLAEWEACEYKPFDGI